MMYVGQPECKVCSKRKSTSLCEVRSLRGFIITEFDLGKISLRGEGVSLLLPLLWKVQKTHWIIFVIHLTFICSLWRCFPISSLNHYDSIDMELIISLYQLEKLADPVNMNCAASSCRCHINGLRSTGPKSGRGLLRFLLLSRTLRKCELWRTTNVSITINILFRVNIP